MLKLTHSHCLKGHPGVKKTTRVITRNNFQPNCFRDVRKHITDCTTGKLLKGNVTVRVGLELYPIQLKPFQVVAMDHMGPLSNLLKVINTF